MKNKHYFFLFLTDNSETNGFYGDFYKKAFFKSLASLRNTDSLTFNLLRGDLILSDIVSRITRVGSDKKSSMIEVSHDPDLALKLSAYLIEYISSMPNTIDSDRYWRDFISTNCYLLGVSTISNLDFIHVDKYLSSNTNGYIGYVEITKFDPLMFQVLFKQLYKNIIVEGRNILYEQITDDEEMFYFIDEEVATEIGYARVQCPYDKFNEIKSKLEIYPNDEFELQSRIPFFYNKNLDQKILSALSSVMKPGGESDFHPSDYGNLNTLNIDKEKIHSYALNTEHKEGRDKAILFKKLLGFEQKDWKFLSIEIQNSMSNLEIFKIGFTEYGVKFSALIDIKGKNDVVKTLETAWMIEEGRGIRLITAYPAVKEKQRDGLEESEVILPQLDRSEVTNLKYKAFYDHVIELAQKAVLNNVPTPAVFDVFDGSTTMLPAGLIGYSIITFANRDDRFVKWLHENCSSCYDDEENIYMNIQMQNESFEQSSVYAKRICELFSENDILCKYEAVYD